MTDYILDNMIVNKRAQHIRTRFLSASNALAYTICDEIAYEQRLAPEEERKIIKSEAKALSGVTDLGLIANITNEMIDDGVLDLDEGGGDVMVAYEASLPFVPNLFIDERVVVSDDNGVRRYCERHNLKVIDSNAYSEIIQSL
jgi:hypothetical protein